MCGRFQSIVVCEWARAQAVFSYYNFKFPLTLFVFQVTSSTVSVYLDSPIWLARALFRSKVDGFVPHTQHVSVRIVCGCNPSEAELASFPLHPALREEKNSLSRPLICTTGRRIPVSSSTNQFVEDTAI